LGRLQPENAAKCIWRPGLARTRRERLQRSPDLLAGFKGCMRAERKVIAEVGDRSRRKRWEGREEGRKRGEEKWKEEKRNLAPTVISKSRRLWQAALVDNRSVIMHKQTNKPTGTGDRRETAQGA